LGDQERTESATPKRRERAHREGDVARSALAPVALSLVAWVAPIAAVPSFATWWIVAFSRCAASAAAAGRGADAASGFALATAIARAMTPWVAIGAPWLAAAAVSLAAAAACGALGWSPGALRWKAARLSPASGLRALVANGAPIQAGIALTAACAVLLCAVPAIGFQVAGAAAVLPAGSQAPLMRAVVEAFWWRAAAALVVLGAADVAFARRRQNARLKMTPREVREERASHEGKPEVKARRRSVAARRSRSLRIAALKRATAVVTNPTHIAVALRYAPPAIDVPLVVSAGKDLAAMLLRGAAEAADVPIVESPDLARALYARVDVDEPIPEELYIAVAAVFAWILKTRGALRGADPG
jgi:flagellar biosynthesis protein FlhB